MSYYLWTSWFLNDLLVFKGRVCKQNSFHTHSTVNTHLWLYLLTDLSCKPGSGKLVWCLCPLSMCSSLALCHWCYKLQMQEYLTTKELVFSCTESVCVGQGHAIFCYGNVRNLPYICMAVLSSFPYSLLWAKANADWVCVLSASFQFGEGWWHIYQLVGYFLWWNQPACTTWDALRLF